MSATFQGTLARNLEFGHILEICAKVQQDGSWFNITLAHNTPEEDTKIEVGLQLLVYLNYNKISLRSGDNDWQEEINNEFTTSLFFEQFRVNIVMSESNFNIAINDKSFSRVPYNLPVNILNTVRITGDLEYIKQVDHRKYFPYTWPPLHLTDKNAAFSNDLPMSYEPGHVMVISVQFLGNEHGRFVLQIKSARDNQREELHLSVRFDTKQFLRNSRTIRHTDKRTLITFLDYGTEETGGGWPFKDFSRPFKLGIAFTETEFYIAKDGKFLYRFPYRTQNVLPDLVGAKLRGNDGLIVRCTGIDHIQMSDPECVGFEKYSKLEKKK